MTDPLADLLVSEGRVDELRAWADSGHENTADSLTSRPTEPSHRYGLPGYKVATLRLADLLIKLGRVDQLRERADTGDRHAAMRLSMLWRDQGRTDELRERAEAGDDHAAHSLVDLLSGQGRVDETIDLLRSWVDAGNGFAIWYLPKLLAEQGDVGETGRSAYLIVASALVGRRDGYSARPRQCRAEWLQLRRPRRALASVGVSRAGVVIMGRRLARHHAAGRAHPPPTRAP